MIPHKRAIAEPGKLKVMQRPRIMILTAIGMEAGVIASKFRQSTADADRNAQLQKGQFDIDIKVIGVGAIRLPPADDAPPEVIIMAGLAGALDPALMIGDLIIDETSTWPDRSLPYPRRKIHTSQSLVATVGDKSNLYAQTGAAAVEMENTAVQELVRKWGTKYLGIRAISDRADQPIDPAVLKCITPFGGAKMNILFKTVRRPGLMKEFYRLFRDSNAALKSLSAALESILSS
jgi:hypothetical protein